MVDRTLIKLIFLSLVSGVYAVMPILARTDSGNELALYFTEAKSPSEREELLKNSYGKMFYFRYLKIYSMEKGETNDYPYVSIVALEPSSSMNISFVVRKTMSLVKLSEDPETKVGDAIAVTGVVRVMDKDRNVMELNPVIVRTKDRFAPKAGKEFLYEIDASATAYSYTGGDEPVNLSKQDLDLLQFKSQYMSQGGTKGKKAWAEFLLKEVAKRERERKAKAVEKFSKFNPAATNSASKASQTEDVAPPSNIVDDPKD